MGSTQIIVIVILSVLAISFVLLMIFIKRIRARLSEAKLEKMKDLVKKGQYDKALSISKSLQNIIPDNYILMYYTALCYEKKEDINKALPIYQKLFFNLKHLPKEISEIQLKKRLASVYKKGNNLKEAQDLYLSILEKEPVDFDASYNLGEIFFNRKAFSNAIKYFETAEHTKPDNVKIKKALSKSYIYSNLFDKAIETLENIIKLEPSNGEAYFDLGKVYDKKMKLKNAITYFEKAEKFNFNFFEAKLCKLDCLLKLDNFAEIIKDLEPFFDKTTVPDKNYECDYRYILAEAYKNSKRIEDALIQWEKIKTFSSNFKDVNFQIDKFNFLKGKRYLENYLFSKDEEFKDYLKNFLKKKGLAEKDIKKFGPGYICVGISKISESFGAIGADSKDITPSCHVYFFCRGSNPLNEAEFIEIHANLISYKGDENLLLNYFGFDNSVYKHHNFTKYSAKEGEDFETFIKEYFQ